MIDVIMLLAVFAAGAVVGWLAASHRTAARNAAHAECVDCTHKTPRKDVRSAQTAARAHRAETGHVVLVVAK